MYSENFFQAIFDSLKEEIVILDESGFIIKTNHSWDQSVKRNKVNLLHYNFLGLNYLATCRNSFVKNEDLIAKEVLDGLEKIYNLELDNFSLEYPCHTPTKKKWYLLKAARIQNTHKLVVSHTNVTEQVLSKSREEEKNKKLAKKIYRKSEKLESLKSSLRRKMMEVIHKDKMLLEKEREVYQAFLKERELNELKTKLITSISHEVRTPLTNIHLSAEILLKYQETLSTEAKQKYLSEIPKSCKKITRILENFFFINKFNSSQKKIKLANTNFKVLLEEVLSDIDQLPIDSNKRIKCKGLGSNPTEVLLDINLVKQIITQLILNALKFSDENSPIIFDLNISDEELYFSVQDFGIGIPELDKDKIFDSFYRGSNIGNKSGVGLGLYIVKESIEVCNGKIEFISSEKEGSVFSVYLPFGRRLVNEEDFNN